MFRGQRKQSQSEEKNSVKRMRRHDGRISRSTVKAGKTTVDIFVVKTTRILLRRLTL
jgi:hypothetical protein